MSTGKITSQAGHAYLGSFLQCKDPETLQKYHSDFPSSPGTKICLKASNLDQLLLAEQQAKEVGISFFRVVNHITRRFKLM
jgi:peptidyl-tRNA hydrolase